MQNAQNGALKTPRLSLYSSVLTRIITCDETAKKQPSLQQTFPQESRIFGSEDAVDVVNMSNSSLLEVFSLRQFNQSRH